MTLLPCLNIMTGLGSPETTPFWSSFLICWTLYLSGNSHQITFFLQPIINFLVLNSHKCYISIPGWNSYKPGLIKPTDISNCCTVHPTQQINRDTINRRVNVQFRFCSQTKHKLVLARPNRGLIFLFPKKRRAKMHDWHFFSSRQSQDR